MIDEAIAAVCKSGQTAEPGQRAGTDQEDGERPTILGQPIKFDAHGDLVNGKFFLFKIDSSGKYQLIPSG